MNCNKYITFFFALLLLLLSQQSSAQCDQWRATAIAESSVCAASGKITVTLNDTAAGSLINIQYRLTAVTGNYNVSPAASGVFQNVPAGTYDVVVSAICNGTTVFNTVRTVVAGNYVPLTATVSVHRYPLHNCNTGQANVTLLNGRSPDSVIIISAPAAYTGRTRFVAAEDFLMDSLAAGVYQISIKDACGTTTPLQSLTVTELPVLIATGNMSYGGISNLQNACNSILVGGPIINQNNIFSQYNDVTSPLMYTVSYDGMAKLPYKRLVANDNTDTITLATGQTAKNTYGKTITYYVKSPCGEETSFTVTLSAPSPSGIYTTHCAVNFDGTYSATNSVFQLICLPLHIKVKNNATSTYLYDTLVNSGSLMLKGLSYGAYTFSATTSDGYIIEDYVMDVDVPVEPNPYAINKGNYFGSYGNDGAGFFYIFKQTGNLAVGTNIKLISPAGYTFDYTVPLGNSSTVFIEKPAAGSSKQYFYPGNYVFRVNDGCNSYDLPITLEDRDVFRYNWSYTQMQTCSGLMIKPTGTAMFAEMDFPVYFKILEGPNGSTGFDDNIHAEGDSLLLPLDGSYKIAIGADIAILNDYGVNTKTEPFFYKPLSIDINNSLGWVCPGEPVNSGSIYAVAINGSKAATGVYTYKLAAQGNGATGPFLATNTTGKFYSTTPGNTYTLTKNVNYDIRAEDECGSAAVQTIKILDFGNAQLASADKDQYCVGEDIHFSIINLPDSAKKFTWTGPDGFSSYLQNPVRTNITAGSEGNYHVVITADICSQPILADVPVKLAPYIISCYSAVTDTSVNPYAYGLLGNWHPKRSYAYYGPRKESVPVAETDIRTDGTFKDFTAFWQVNTKKWSAHKDTTKWVWNAESTIFNGKGFELENRDPLGRYNSGIYGYDNAIPVAVIQNSRYCEAAFEGFEDYGFDSNVCDTACSSGRRFDFSVYKSRIDSSQHHTGRYSIRLQPGDTVGIISTVLDKAVDLTEPTFNKGDDSCSTSGQVLKSVRAGAGTVLPSFTPLAGKKILFSAWVLEARDSNTVSYKDNKVILAVKNDGGNTQTMSINPTGNIIEGWQRYEQVIELPVGSNSLSLLLLSTGTAKVYFDDIRIHPYNANMKSFIYDATTLRMMAELDENNYATFFEYDDDGTLTRVKKETERGIKTIRETRSALIKE
jgi:hypothetical protein